MEKEPCPWSWITFPSFPCWSLSLILHGNERKIGKVHYRRENSEMTALKRLQLEVHHLKPGGNKAGVDVCERTLSQIRWLTGLSFSTLPHCPFAHFQSGPADVECLGHSPPTEPVSEAMATPDALADAAMLRNFVQKSCPDCCNFSKGENRLRDGFI